MNFWKVSKRADAQTVRHINSPFILIQSVFKTPCQRICSDSQELEKRWIITDIYASFLPSFLSILTTILIWRYTHGFRLTSFNVHSKWRFGSELAQLWSGLRHHNLKCSNQFVHDSKLIVTHLEESVAEMFKRLEKHDLGLWRLTPKNKFPMKVDIWGTESPSRLRFDVHRTRRTDGRCG